MFCHCPKCRKAAAVLAGIGILALPVHAYHRCESDTELCAVLPQHRAIHPEEPIGVTATGSASLIYTWVATATSSAEPSLSFEGGRPILTF